ncbi:type VII secretion-associated protein [Pseudonocardia sp. TRM90224]|uniref:type VII secretion-associated protein n=1 Tax=Pseudonocardia sp. TRM90224 TaxID=2812678 RepID=UPI001E45A8B5|nr:type VII secretion-associated protein [Pseudonocardia sp. TRM90224]
MNVPAARVALQVGSTGIRVAARGFGGPPWVADAAQWGEPADVLAELFGSSPADALLVHSCRRGPAGSGWGTTLPAPVAAAMGAGADGGVRAVLDVGATGAEAAVVEGGRVLAARSGDAGGDRLDDALVQLLDAADADRAEVRRVRERLSLHPRATAHLAGGAVPVTAERAAQVFAPVLDEAVALLAGVHPPGAPGAVLLVGGVARTPLLAEMLDAAGWPEVRVAPRPETAAVSGALLVPENGLPAASVPVGRAAPERSWLPSARQSGGWRRRGRIGLVVAASVGGAGTLLAAGSVLGAPPAPGVGALVQYGYRFDLPAGWAHSGGQPERRRTVLTPAAAPLGSDLIAVERSPLGYDAAAEPARAADELRAVFDAAVAAGSPLSGFEPAAAFAGRTIARYREQEPHGVVDWYVVLDGDAQLSVGCRHTAAGAAAVRAACARVVASLTRS